MREDKDDEVIPWSGKAREFSVDSSMFSDRVLLERLSEQLVPVRIYYARGSAAKQKRGQTQKRCDVSAGSTTKKRRVIPVKKIEQGTYLH
jgi:hypothetical protein